MIKYTMKAKCAAVKTLSANVIMEEDNTGLPQLVMKRLRLRLT